MQKKLLLMAFTMATAFSTSAQTIWEWKYGSSRDLMADRIYFYSTVENKFNYSVSEKEKTPDGDKTLEIKIINSALDAPAHAKQINYRYGSKLTQGQKIKLSFYYNGSKKGKISFVAAQASAPYKALGRTAGNTLNVTTQWQIAEIVFTVSKDFAPPMSMPRLMLGKYPVGGVLHLGPVKMQVLQTLLPLSLNENWKLYKPVDDKDYPASPPANTESVQLKNGRINLATIPKLKSSVILYNEFNSPSDGVMKIGMAADWWFECLVNGKKVYDTLKTGNISHRFSPLDHIFTFPVKKGKNTMIVKVISGSNGCVLVADKVPFLATSSTNSITKISANKDWKPINMKKLTVSKGTALDFSGLGKTGCPAGIYGRVIINSHGKLALENKPDQAIRLYGFNTWAAGYVNQWSKEDIKKFAEDVAVQGYNHIRIQGINSLIMGGEKRWGKWGGKMMRPIEDALKDKELPIVADSVDKFDYLLSCLKENGIYYNLDFMHMGTGCLMVHPKISYGKNFRIQLYFNPDYRKNWLKAFTFFLTHHNKYTGMALKDDPALMCVEFFNEQDINPSGTSGMEALSPLFHKYLKNKYNNVSNLNEAWKQNYTTFQEVPVINGDMLMRGDVITGDAGDFLIQLMSDTTDWYFKQIRNLGYKGIVSQWDMIMRTLDIPLRAKMPVVAQHSYFAHPNRYPTKNLVVKSKDNALFGLAKQDLSVHQGSSFDSSYIRSTAAIRFIDRPFMLTEYSHSFFNSKRYERGLYCSAYGALQGWSAMLCHGSPVQSNFNMKNPLLPFENAADPISRASEIITALAWFRGDVSKAKSLVAFKLQKENVFPKYTIAAIGDDYARLAMITGIGITYPAVTPLMPVGKVIPDLTIEPKEFTKIKIKERWASNSSADGSVFSDLLDKLKQKKIITSSNKTDYKKRIFQSDTGEITLYGKTKTMTVLTPRFEGAIIKENRAERLGYMTVKSASKPCAVALASLDPDCPISKSKHLLLVLSTNALNSDMVIVEAGTLCVDIGHLPVLMETSHIELSINTSQTTSPQVYALNMDGTRSETVTSKFNNGELLLDLDTSTLKYATPFFEIVFP